MRPARPAALATTLCALAALALPAPAAASFGLAQFDATFTGPPPAESEPGTLGPASMQAGSHPFAYTTTLRLASTPREVGSEVLEIPDGDIKDLTIAQIPGLVPNLTAIGPCSSADFAAEPIACPAASMVGKNLVTLSGGTEEDVPVYDLAPPPGVPLKLGFSVLGVRVVLLARLSTSPPYNGLVELRNVPQVIPFLASRVTIWGVPADPAHDAERGGSTDAPEVPFLTVPRACEGALATGYELDSWQSPGAFLTGSVPTHNDAVPPEAEGFTGCGKLGFSPSIAARPTTRAASSASGLDFSLDTHDEESLANQNEGAVADSDIEKAVVTLPAGMTVNPSEAEGLAGCSEADLERESLDSAFGEGCPAASKLGTIEVETPLLARTLGGTLFLATPYANRAGDSLIALYVVIRDPSLGIFVTQALRVEPDPATGRLITTAEDMPQLPFSSFRLHFREGTRAPLITPPSCGAHTATALLYPYSGNPPVESTSAFQIVSGPNGSPCPAGAAPFSPGFEAGTLNNAAGRYSPLAMRLTRGDAEQDLVRFSAKLPPGLTAKLAGTAECTDAAIARARSRQGPHGGAEELARPSCPAASEIGTVTAGAGVGSELTYVNGSLYLAGPYHGAPLSVAAIVPAVAGPFDAGVVVTREALRIDPLTAEVEVDGSASDPIPHILKGIPLSVRDIRVEASREGFTLNPTSCEEMSIGATLWGGGTALAPAAFAPASLAQRFQAAGCASLGFTPHLFTRLFGKTTRGAHPRLRAVLLMAKAGQAGVSRAALTLPRSELLDQNHIGTTCTRVQYNAGAGGGAQCPKRSIYGYAVARTPLLREPLKGPVFLRSNGGERELPDLVASLNGKVHIDLIGYVDSVHARIRTRFTSVPDAPVRSFALTMKGGGKGLLVNKTDICAHTFRSTARFAAHNGAREVSHPALGDSACARRRRRAQAMRRMRRRAISSGRRPAAHHPHRRRR